MTMREPAPLQLRHTRTRPTEIFNTLPEGVAHIDCYGTNIIQNIKGKDKKRRYFIELHHYDGAAFIKFYPKTLAKNPQKFCLRENDIGYNLTRGEIIQILFTCGSLMKTYLDKHPHNFIGYVGQPDKKDNKRKRENSQRYSVYGYFTTTLFKAPKYKHSSESIFGPINMNIIRKQFKNVNGGLSERQTANYERLSVLLTEQDFTPIMTEVTQRNQQNIDTNKS